METIKFKVESLADYKTINEPGRYDLKVLSNVGDNNLVADADGSNPRYIVNLKAIAKDKLAQVAQVFAGKAEVPIEETNGCFLTANIWKREGQTPDLPMKGETVEVTIEEVPARDTEEPVLRITNLKRKAAKAAPAFDLAALKAVDASEKKTELQHA